MELTMENLDKEVKNMNTLIDMIDSRQDDKRLKIINFFKLFCNDMIEKMKNKDNSNNTKNESDMPIIEKINKSLLNLLQLKPMVMQKYGTDIFETIYQLNDEEVNYTPPDDLLSQPCDKRLTSMEIMKYFLQLFFGGEKKIDEILTNEYIIIDSDKRSIHINEEKIKTMSQEPDKYIHEKSLLVNLMLIKIFSYIKKEKFYTILTGLLKQVENKVIKFYKMLSLLAMTLWNLTNKKEEYVRSLLFNLGKIIKNFSLSYFKTEKIDFSNLKYFIDEQKDSNFFEPNILPEKSKNLLTKYLLLTIVNFTSVFICGYDANQPYDIQDGNYWDDYHGLILRLKDPKLTPEEMKEIPRMIPLSLDMKSIIILFVTDFLFFFCTNFISVKDDKLVSEFEHFDTLKIFGEYLVLNASYNILTFFIKNFPHKRFDRIKNEKNEYEMKNNYNTYGLFFILFCIITEKKVPLIINKYSYLQIMTSYLRIVLAEAKDYGVENVTKNIMKYYINELTKCRMVDLEDIKDVAP